MISEIVTKVVDPLTNMGIKGQRVELNLGERYNNNRSRRTRNKE